MIKFIVEKKENFISFIEIKGHANKAPYGEDIVCAGVSSLVISHINLIERFNLLKNIETKIEEGYFSIKVLSNDNNIELILLNIVEMLEQMVILYPKNIKKEN